VTLKCFSICSGVRGEVVKRHVGGWRRATKPHCHFSNRVERHTGVGGERRVDDAITVSGVGPADAGLLLM